MKKQTRRVFGLCGLAVVGVTTAIAASLPAPQTSATDGDMSSTDTVIVRVVSNTPDVNVGGVTSGTTVVSPEQTLSIDYSEGVDYVDARLEYTDIHGNTDVYNFERRTTDYHAGVWELPLDLTSLVGEGGLTFGYGHYKFISVGTGYNGETDTDALEFDYAAAIIKDGGVDENDNVVIDIESDGKYASDITVYDGDKVVTCASVTVTAGTKQVILPFADCGLPSGTYKIVINSIDAKGNIISSFSITIDYTAPEEVPVPNTGILTIDTNISRTDYLVTGLIVFGVITMIGIALVVRRRKKSFKK